jgi:hypothetical protein
MQRFTHGKLSLRRNKKPGVNVNALAYRRNSTTVSHMFQEGGNI